MDSKKDVHIRNNKFIMAVNAILKGERDSKDVVYRNDSVISNILYKDNRGFVSSIRAGTRGVPYNTMVKFAEYFGIPKEYFETMEAVWTYKGVCTSTQAVNIQRINLKKKQTYDKPEAGSFTIDPSVPTHLSLDKELQHYKTTINALAETLTPKQQSMIIAPLQDIIYSLIIEREKSNDALNHTEKELASARQTIEQVTKELDDAKDAVITAKNETIVVLKKCLERQLND